MKLIIAGGRRYQLTDLDYHQLDKIHQATPVAEVVSGAASGVDLCGERWARLQCIPIKRFPAHWNTLGRSAGPARNAEMAGYADAVALFYGGRGTENMHQQAVKRGLKVFDFRPVEDCV